jgi:hypothetical protein
MSNRRRLHQASEDIAIRAQSNGHVKSDPGHDEDHDSCDCPACIAEDTAPVLFDMLIGDTDPVADPIEAECGMAMLLTMGYTAGVDHDEWHDVVLADLVEAGTTQAAGMMAALVSLSEGRARADALTAIAEGPSLPEWAKELIEPVTAVRCLRLQDRDGDVWALAAEFSRGDERHAFVLLTEPNECGAAVDLVACGADELPSWLKSVKRTASDEHYELKEIALDPGEFREQAEAAIEERHSHDAYDLIDDEDFDDEDFDEEDFDDEEDSEGDEDFDGEDDDFIDDIKAGELSVAYGSDLDIELGDMPDELPDDLGYYTLLPVFQARLRMLPQPPPLLVPQT